MCVLCVSSQLIKAIQRLSKKQDQQQGKNMQVTCEVKENTPRSYPWLGVSPDNEVVLFSDYGVGTRLRSSNGVSPIYHSRGWRMESFKEFVGTIKVTN